MGTDGGEMVGSGARGLLPAMLYSRCQNSQCRPDVLGLEFFVVL